MWCVALPATRFSSFPSLGFHLGFKCWEKRSGKESRALSQFYFSPDFLLLAELIFSRVIGITKMGRSLLWRLVDLIITNKNVNILIHLVKTLIQIKFTTSYLARMTEDVRLMMEDVRLMMEDVIIVFVWQWALLLLSPADLHLP